MADSATKKPKMVFVLGRPGAGKGTVCKSVEEEFGFVHLSAGQLLREERNKADSPYKVCIDEHCNKGLMIPANITYTLLEHFILHSTSHKFLIDAFPPDLENLHYWIKSDLSKITDMPFVLFVDCPEDICSQRILERGATGNGRDDDIPSKLNNRFNIFNRDSMRVIQYFQELGIVRRVDASGSTQEVYSQVQTLFRDIC